MTQETLRAQIRELLYQLGHQDGSQEQGLPTNPRALWASYAQGYTDAALSIAESDTLSLEEQTYRARRRTEIEEEAYRAAQNRFFTKIHTTKGQQE
jgi:hypothetical protein